MKRRNQKNKRPRKPKAKNQTTPGVKSKNLFLNWKIIPTIIAIIAAYYGWIKPLLKDTTKLFEKPLDQKQIAVNDVRFIRKLQELNHEYDKSRSKEAIDQIATILYYNFHKKRHEDPSSFNSIINNTKFINSATIDRPGNWLAYDGLTYTKTVFNPPSEPTIEFIAYARKPDFERSEIPYLPFEFWWETAIILDDRWNNKFTRKNIILSYVLFEIDGSMSKSEKYTEVKKLNFLGYGVDKNGIYLDANSGTGKPIKPKATPDFILNSLLMETIRGISGEVVLTFIEKDL